MTTKTISYDDETMTLHRDGCNHITIGLVLGEASNRDEAMALDATQDIINEMFEGDSTLVWFQSCTGIKNPSGQTKPVW